MNVKKSGIDLLSMSSHKIHGMKGVGALYINGKPKISPLFFGGGQQRNIRPGTENSLGIMTFAAAAKEFYAKINENKAAAARIKNLIISGLSGAVINSPENASPYILNISFPGIMAEVLLHALEEVGIFVSAGAACSARIKNHSVLTAYGKPAEIAESSIRLSFSHENTIDEAAYFIEKINEIVPKLKR
jgi:cysteine desulfurase